MQTLKMNKCVLDDFCKNLFNEKSALKNGEGDVGGTVRFPLAFFGEEWAREHCGDTYLDAYETCAVKQYQPKATGTNACEEGF